MEHGFDHRDRFPCHVVAHVRQVRQREHRAFEPEQPIDLPSWTKLAADGRNNSDTERGIWIAGAHNSSAGTKQQHQRVADALPFDVSRIEEKKFVQV